MQRILNLSLTILVLQIFTILAVGQSSNLSGKWEGKTVSPQGERPTTATFKKEGESYTGSISGMRGEMPLKDIKIDGNKITAKAELETPQGALTIDYNFDLQGDGLKGTGSLNLGGNPITFEVNLKRTVEGATATAPAPAASEQTRPAPRAQRVLVGQPQQKQSIDYFVGAWNFKFIGRESAFGAAPREGVVTFTKRPDGNSVSGAITGQSDGKAYKETSLITFDEATKKMKFDEKLSTGVKLQSEGDWSSPIAIKFTIPSVKYKGQSLQLKRTISIVSPHSFSVQEELSEDGGSFVRLGNTIYSKNEAK
jgi:hypothetical protein